MTAINFVFEQVEYTGTVGAEFQAIGIPTSGGSKTLRDALILDNFGGGGSVGPWSGVPLVVRNNQAHVEGVADVTLTGSVVSFTFTTIMNSSESDNSSLPTNWAGTAVVHTCQNAGGSIDQPIEPIVINGLVAGDWSQSPAPNTSGFVRDYIHTLASTYNVNEAIINLNKAHNDYTGSEGTSWNWHNVVAGQSNQIRFQSGFNIYPETIYGTVISGASLFTVEHLQITNTQAFTANSNQTYSLTMPLPAVQDLDKVQIIVNSQGRLKRNNRGGQIRINDVFLSGTSASPVLNQFGAYSETVANSLGSEFYIQLIQYN